MSLYKNYDIISIRGIILCVLLFGTAPCISSGLPEKAAPTLATTIITNDVDEFLATSPGLGAAKIRRENIQSQLSIIKNKIDRAEKELKHIQNALSHIAGENISDGDRPNAADNSLASRKRDKELELAELKLGRLSTEEALALVNTYIHSQERQSIFYRDIPLWQVADISRMQAERRDSAGAATTDSMQLSAFALAPGAIVLLLLAVMRLKRARDLITNRLERNNSFHLGVNRFSHMHLSGRVLVFLLCVVAFAGFAVEPQSGQGLWSYGGLFFYFWMIVSLFIQLAVDKLATSRATAKDDTFEVSHFSAAAFFSGLWTSLLIMFESGFSAASFSIGWSWLVLPIITISWLIALPLMVQRLCRSANRNRLCKAIRLPIWTFAVSCILLELFGYRVLVSFVLSNIGKTVVLTAALVVSLDAVDLLITVLDGYKSKLIAALGLEELESGTKFSPMSFLGTGVKCIIYLLSLVAFIKIWDITQIADDKYSRVLFDGFSLGGLQISPARIIMAFLLLTLGWPLVTTVVQLFEKKWLASAALSSSSRETILTLFGYGGYVTIILLSLSLAGVQLMGLTVVIGALSLGIGFGLQNIINNFISGLILMFERPIKKGDWILVGTTEGYVKKISIRSTIIQTFDRSDVIVPNSELIANQVTNMMLYDQKGRLRVSVGVAYGSDTRLVHDLMLQVAADNPHVITDGSFPEPKVLFQAFGDSSLNFDLLCYLKDIDNKLRARSEMHFAIDDAFRQHGVEIPFPQRDIHIKSRASE